MIWPLRLLRRTPKPTFDLAYVQPMADAIVALLQPVCSHVSVVGSVRRQEPAVHDLDILYVLRNDHLPAEFVTLLEAVADDPSHVKLRKYRYQFTMNGVPCDVIPTTEPEWGMSLIKFTGSRRFNDEMLRPAAGRRGYTVIDSALYVRKSDGYNGYYAPQMHNKGEQEILALLGLNERFGDPAARALP